MKLFVIALVATFGCFLPESKREGLLGSHAHLFSDEVSNIAFPEGYMWGYASAAYQGQNGDIACNACHDTDVDVGLLVRQGVNTYRFSIAWSTVLPTGHIDNINEKGLEYYRDLIQKLRANNIEPLVTMHHWDNPEPSRTRAAS
ncbi:hypothetical protein YQE_04906, partial [Dendroctonus ponderosae]